MAANAFNNTAKITKQAMNVLRNNLVLVPRVNRTYEKEFSQGNGKIGDTVSVRIPGYGTVRRDWSTSAWGEILVPGEEATEARAAIADYLAALEQGGMVRDEDVEGT